MPLVTIGMPVYNSARTISYALDALLAQSLADFEIIISDNASTDDTVEVLDRYARADRRIRIIRQTINIGANPNYAAVARAANGKYFKWASSNDWCAPTFLEQCVAALEGRADAVVSYPKTRLYAESIEAAEDYDDALALEQESAAERFWRVVHCMRLNNVMNGVIRTSTLKSIKPMSTYFGADVVLVSELALRGKLIQVPAYLFYRRMDPATATRLRSRVEVLKHHFPTRTVRSLFPAWRLYGSWVRVALTSPIGLSDRLRVSTVAFKMLVWKRRELLDDLIGAAEFFRPRTSS